MIEREKVEGIVLIYSPAEKYLNERQHVAYKGQMHSTGWGEETTKDGTSHSVSAFFDRNPVRDPWCESLGYRQRESTIFLQQLRTVRTTGRVVLSPSAIAE